MMPGYKVEAGDGPIGFATEREIDAQLCLTITFGVLEHLETDLEGSQDEALVTVTSAE